MKPIALEAPSGSGLTGSESDNPSVCSSVIKKFAKDLDHTDSFKKYDLNEVDRHRTWQNNRQV